MVASSVPSPEFFKGGTPPGGGGGGGVPRIFARIHFPRITGDVRFPSDVIVRMLACPCGCRLFPCVAELSSSSSGALLHRKYESRDASSRSATRYTLFGAAPAGSCSMRNRN